MAPCTSVEPCHCLPRRWGFAARTDCYCPVDCCSRLPAITAVRVTDEMSDNRYDHLPNYGSLCGACMHHWLQVWHILLTLSGTLFNGQTDQRLSLPLGVALPLTYELPPTTIKPPSITRWIPTHITTLPQRPTPGLISQHTDPVMITDAGQCQPRGCMIDRGPHHDHRRRNVLEGGRAACLHFLCTRRKAVGRINDPRSTLVI